MLFSVAWIEPPCTAVLAEGARRFDDGSAHEIRELALSLLARRQRGVVHGRQLTLLGFSTSALARRVRQGRLVRVGRGTFAVGGAPLAGTGRDLAAVLSAVPAVLSHTSAAAAWDLLPHPSGPPDVTVADARAPRPGAAARVHRSRTLLPEDVEVVDGTPTTSVARTLADLGNVVGVGRVRSAFIAGERRGLIDMNEVEAVLARAGRTPGARRLRDVVRRYDPRWQQTRSGLEVRAFESLRRHGMPLPEVNAQIGDRYLADLLWPDARLVVEIDSDRFHANPIDRRADARRDAHLRAAGYTVLRIPEAEIAAGADAVALRVTAALAARRPRQR